MRTVNTLNNQLFVEPFKDTEIKTVTKSGFATVKQKHELTKLKVLVGNKDGSIKEGDFVYVKGDICKAHFATEKFVLNGVEGIFLSEANVLIVDAELYVTSGYIWEKMNQVATPAKETTTTVSVDF